jgi:hypothetical protein
MSLSIVFGQPITGTPRLCNRDATLNVSSPPIAINATSSFCRMFAAIRSSCSSVGLVREVPRMVPPRCRMPDTFSRLNGMTSFLMAPAQPLRKPITCQPSTSARRVMARMAAFRPGQSPPPVNIANLFMLNFPPEGMFARGSCPPRARGETKTGSIHKRCRAG